MGKHEDTGEDDDFFARPTAGEYREFFDAICDYGLGEPRYRETIAKASLKNCRSLYAKLCRDWPLGDHATMNHSPSMAMEIIASDSLSGGPHPCVSPDCRSTSAEIGARFAALYADHVIIRDPLGVHGSEDDRERLIAAMEVMYRWRPLFEAGLASHVVRICAHCAAQRLNRLARVPTDVPRLERRVSALFAKARFVIERIDETSVGIHVSAKEGVLPHGDGGFTYEGRPARPFLKLLGRRSEVRLPLPKARTTGALARMTEPIVHEMLMQHLHRTLTSPNAHYASNMPAELELANAFAPTSMRWPRGLLDALAHTVPVLGHASISDIVRFRLSDAPAFQRYRNHVRSLSEQTDDKKALFDAAASLNADYAGLEQALRSSRSGLWKKARNELLLFGSIGVGLAGIVGLKGLLALATPALGSVKDAVRPRVNDEAQKHPLYFLWRLQNRR